MKRYEKMGDGKSVPTGVKVISVLYYIGAVLIAIFALFIFIAAVMIVQNPTAPDIPKMPSEIPFPFSEAMGISVFLIVGGVIFVGYAILLFLVGRGLWKAKKWARIVAIIFSCFMIFLSVSSMLIETNFIIIFILIMNLAIGSYLFFNHNVKKAFA